MIRLRLADGRRCKAWIASLAISSVLLACSSAPKVTSEKDDFMVVGLVFENRSRTAISAIQLIVSETGEYVSCGNVPAGGTCASGFPGRIYRGYPVEVTWSQSGAIWSTGALKINVSDEVLEAGLAQVRVVVVAPGSAGVLLVPGATP